MNRTRSIFVLLNMLLLAWVFSCTKPERDNPWDENSTLNPEDWAPKDFQVEKVTVTSNRLTWSYDEHFSIEGFRVDRKKGDEAWQEAISKLPKESRSWEDENVEPDSTLTYTYRLYAFAGNQLSKEENIASAGAIAAPSALRLEMKSLISVALTWQYTLSGIEGFTVERKQDDGNWQQFSQLSANEFIYVDNAVDPLNHDYYYRVFAWYRNYTSLASPIVVFGSRITENALGVNLVLKRIVGGIFEMGSTENSNSQPTHTVTLNTFYIGMFEITQAQWYAVMGTSPSYFTNCNDCPVEQVSWNDIQEFLQKLNQASGHNYALPSEAQWEYAAGGGATNRTIWAGTNSESDLGGYAWYGSNSSQTHSVGTNSPNTLGLYDMSGNVWEWCEDDYHGNYQGAPAYSGAWIDSPRGSYRMIRGGSWSFGPTNCHVAYRSSSTPASRYYSLGFRVVLVP